MNNSSWYRDAIEVRGFTGRAVVTAGTLVAALALVATPLAHAFTPDDPLAPEQWYLSSDHAFDAWPTPPSLLPVKVAVIDSGIDGSHPEFAGKIVAARSFVGGDPLVDTNGHGTFVAGEIAATVGNGIGIAGVAPSAQLVIAKVTDASGDIPMAAEAAAIRWAVTAGARVINLSLGGLRDPLDPHLDTYSPLESAAISYAIAHHVVVVAAVGNGTAAPREPWPYADYPAALPHVIGVGALTRSGDVPAFSNRDTRYVGLVAPGADILSTLPTVLTAADPGCADQGYSDCGPGEFRDPIGTSFAAPQVSAAAADLLGIDPTLLPDQVAWLLERTADDVTPATGCALCSSGRDALSGFGRLDVAAAVAALAAHRQPPPDPYDPNGDVGQAVPLWGRSAALGGTVDYWQNPDDVFRTYLRAGQGLAATLQAPPQARLRLWRPGTPTVTARTGVKQRFLAASTGSAPAHVRRLHFDAPRTGWYFLDVEEAAPGAAAYTLSVQKAIA